MNDPINEVRLAIKRFQEGYTKRDVSKLDEFMNLFVHNEDVELIGIGASERGGNEWFQGVDSIREIIESDWKYWGKVALDIEGAKIRVQDGVAWLSTTGSLTQTPHHASALPLYLEQMKKLIEDKQVPPEERLLESTHFGMRRLREWNKGEGHTWPFVFSAVLTRTRDGWQFHQIHWSMPVD